MATMCMRVLLALVLCAVVAGAAQQTPSFNLTVSGEQTWTIRLGLGSASLLQREDLSPGQPALTQSLRAEIEGKALGFLTLRASFNDQLGPGFQEFLLIADRQPWTGELGRFVVGAEGEGLGVYNKRVLGGRVSFAGDGVTASAVVTRVEGISETRTFRGERGFAEALYSADDPDQPWLPAPYLRSVEGLAYWPLRMQFVEGLSDAKLRLAGEHLWRFLADWGLGYLREDLAAEPETPLTGGEFVVLRGNGDALALRVAPAALARKRIRDAVDAHNARLGLTGKDRKVYPFVEGSELEDRFLADLGRFVAVVVGDEVYPFPQAQRRRYLALGERDVIEGTVEVFLRLPGETEFRPSTDPDLAAFEWTLLPAEGVLRIAFPEEFFPGGAVRVAFSYRREGGTFMLGLSVVPGSERVFLNRRLLARGTDYTIDYELGMLLLFAPLRPEDELVVDFERQRGGLGGHVEYERNMFGLVLAVPGWDGFRLAVYRTQDFGAPGPTTHTMPNAHSVAALSWAGKIAGWAYRLNLGGSENVFPADDNARAPSPNRINAIASAHAPDGEYVVFAHQNGLTVHKDGAFAGYGTAHGLLGRAAYSAIALPGQLLVGTDAGLTVVRLTESAPFDRVRSWVRLSEANGVPGTEVVALARGGGLVFLATDADVASFSPADAEAPQRWQKLSLPDGEPRPTALLWAEGRLYLGTTHGLFVHAEGNWVPVAEVAGGIHALAARGSDVYVASDDGIRILRGGTGVGWVVLGRPVYALTLREGRLWYATGDALWQEGDAAPTVRGRLAAVGVGPDGVWAGGEADEEFRLDLWRVGDRVERFPQSRTRLDGRDLARFRDVPAGEHTRYGATGSLVLDRTVGDWQWELRLASRMPGYEEIGRLGRSDSHGLGLTARYGSGPTTIELRGRWDVMNLTTRPTGRLSGGLDWRWSDGPTASLSLTPTFTGGGAMAFDRLEMGWNAGVSNQTQLWSWGLTTSGSLRHPALAATGQVGATAMLRPARGWDLDLGWTLPFRTAAALGEQTFRAVVKWAFELDHAFLDATWRETLRHHLTTGTWAGERTIEATARGKPWAVARGELSPRLLATLTETPAERRWTGRVEGNFARTPVVLRLGVTVGHGFRPATERSEQTLAVSLGWEHSGLDGVRASLQWDKSWTALSHPRYPTQVTEREQAVARVTWDPTGARWRNVLTLSWKPADREITLTNRVSWPLEHGAVTAETSAKLNGEELDVKTSAELGLPLDAVLRAVGARPVGDAWGLSAELGHVLGVKQGSEPSHALFLGVTLAVRF
jgi:hypothetical protein